MFTYKGQCGETRYISNNFDSLARHYVAVIDHSQRAWEEGRLDDMKIWELAAQEIRQNMKGLI